MERGLPGLMNIIADRTEVILAARSAVRSRLDAEP
jgi:hypothetical protein